MASYQMLLRMKKSWMKMQPKGRMPPMTMPGTGLVKNDCSGICLGIWLVLTGCSMACRMEQERGGNSSRNGKLYTILERAGF